MHIEGDSLYSVYILIFIQVRQLAGESLRGSLSVPLHSLLRKLPLV